MIQELLSLAITSKLSRGSFRKEKVPLRGGGGGGGGGLIGRPVLLIPSKAFEDL